MVVIVVATIIVVGVVAVTVVGVVAVTGNLLLSKVVDVGIVCSMNDCFCVTHARARAHTHVYTRAHTHL